MATFECWRSFASQRIGLIRQNFWKKKNKNNFTYEDVARENCGISSELNGLAVQPTRSNETEYRKKRYSKPADRGVDCELKSPQKRANKPAKTAIRSKLESALCSRVLKQTQTPNVKFRLHNALVDPFPRTQCSEMCCEHWPLITYSRY